jgi:hypothetical protein
MKRLPVLFFAAAIAVWGLASIPDGSSDEKSLQVSAVRTAATHRYGRSAGTPRDTLTARTAVRGALIVVGLGPE